MTRLLPQRPAPDATELDHLRYVRHWAIIGALLSIPVWALLLLTAPGDVTILVFAAVTALTVYNIVSLSRRIARAERR